jgi:hypothetical protein
VVLLRALITDVNKNKLSTPILINLYGVIISGDLISGKEYFDLLKKNGTDLSDLASVYSSIYDGKTVETENPQFIHLKNVTFHNTGFPNIVNKEQALWRGRIDSVDGYILGKIDTES